MVVWRTVLVAGVSAVALAGSACGTIDPGAESGASGSAPPATTDGAAADGALLAWCDDVPVPGPIAETEPPALSGPDPTLLGVLNRYAAEHPDTYGGLWIDQVHGGTIVLAFTDDPAPHRAAIGGLTAMAGDPTGIAPTATTGAAGSIGTPPPTAPPSSTVAESGAVVDVVQVAHTDLDLQSTRDEVTALMDDPSLTVSSVGIDPMKNRVAISVEGEVDDQVRRTAASRVPADAVCLSGGPPVAPSYERPATMIPAEGGDPWVTCTGTTMPFRASALSQPVVLAPDDPLQVAFDEMVSQGGMGSPDEWFLLVRDGDSAVYAFGNPPTSFAELRYEQGRWIRGMSSSGGACELRALQPEGVAELDWSFDPAYPAPAAGDTVLHLLATRRDCTGGEPVDADDLVGPEVVERGGQVLLAVGVDPMPPGSYTCIGPMPDAIEVTLEAPLGAGELVDGTYLPPRPIVVGPTLGP